MKLLTREGDPSFIHSFSWDFKLIIRKDEFRMTPFWGRVMRKAETAVCPREI
jgi:hypothetical protein